jgi:hypothetical protein
MFLILSQTLRMLDLRYNEIGDEGIQYLANALRYNRVVTIASLLRIDVFFI